MTKDTKDVATRSKPGTTKKTQLIRMLSTRTGAEVAAISGKLGWQSHTTRAAITGLRKAGFGIDAARPEAGKPTRYRIVSVPEEETAATASGAIDAQ